MCIRDSLADGQDDGLLFGVNRAVRSDEWAVNTPMAFAQYYDPQGAYPYFGQVMRGAITDSFIVYGQPVWDIAVSVSYTHLDVYKRQVFLYGER